MAAFGVACALSGPLEGQAEASAPVACTYQACALRIFDSAILAGQEGRKVASFGFLSPPTLGPWIEVSDSASHYADVVRENYGPGATLSFVGTLVGMGGYLLAAVGDGSAKEWVGLGILGAGWAAAVSGNRRERLARDAMTRAVWWYNAELARAEAQDAPLPTTAVARPEPGRQHHGRTGLVLGSAAGIVVGLAVSSRHDRSRAGLGAAETLAMGAVGAFFGWSIAHGIRRDRAPDAAEGVGGSEDARPYIAGVNAIPNW